MTPTTYGRDFAYCLKSHGGVRGFNASLWRFLLRCTLFCHSVATFLTSVSSYEGGCGFEVLNKFFSSYLEFVRPSYFIEERKTLFPTILYSNGMAFFIRFSTAPTLSFSSVYPSKSCLHLCSVPELPSPHTNSPMYAQWCIGQPSQRQTHYCASFRFPYPPASPPDA